MKTLKRWTHLVFPLLLLSYCCASDYTSQFYLIMFNHLNLTVCDVTLFQFGQRSYIKEITFVDLRMPHQKHHYVFNLSGEFGVEDVRNSTCYHGMSLESGQYKLSDLPFIIREHANSCMILIKGHVKAKLLQTYTKRNFVYDIHELGIPSFDVLLENCFDPPPVCEEHKLNSRFYYHTCSFAKLTALVHFILDHPHMVDLANYETRLLTFKCGKFNCEPTTLAKNGFVRDFYRKNSVICIRCYNSISATDHEKHLCEPLNSWCL